MTSETMCELKTRATSTDLFIFGGAITTFIIGMMLYALKDKWFGSAGRGTRFPATLPQLQAGFQNAAMNETTTPPVLAKKMFAHRPHHLPVLPPKRRRYWTCLRMKTFPNRSQIQNRPVSYLTEACPQMNTFDGMSFCHCHVRRVHWSLVNSTVTY